MTADVQAADPSLILHSHVSEQRINPVLGRAERELAGGAAKGDRRSHSASSSPSSD